MNTKLRVKQSLVREKMPGGGPQLLHGNRGQLIARSCAMNMQHRKNHIWWRSLCNHESGMLPSQLCYAVEYIGGIRELAEVHLTVLDLQASGKDAAEGSDLPQACVISMLREAQATPRHICLAQGFFKSRGHSAGTPRGLGSMRARFLPLHSTMGHTSPCQTLRM